MFNHQGVDQPQNSFFFETFMIRHQDSYESFPGLLASHLKYRGICRGSRCSQTLGTCHAVTSMECTWPWRWHAWLIVLHLATFLIPQIPRIYTIQLISNFQPRNQRAKKGTPRFLSPTGPSLITLAGNSMDPGNFLGSPQWPPKPP